MAIHFISGKPGGGKSMLGVKRMMNELRHGVRNISVNLPLNLGRLNEYVQEAFPSEDLQVLQRVRVLTEDEAKQFWKYRGPDDDKGGKGVLFILDELHLFFNARDWMQTGRDCLHYLSQHRKMGDTVLGITQAIQNVDKQFRSVAQDFTVVRNEYTAKYWIFRGRGRFVWKSYLSEPSGSGNQVPFEQGTFTLDVTGVASCYDTAQGVGVQGTVADKGARAKGIPVMWVFPMMIGVASLCGIVPWALGKGAQKYVGGSVQPKVQKVGEGSPVVQAQQDPENRRAPGERNFRPLYDRELPTVSGIVAHNGRVNVLLSDGRILTEEDGSLKFIGRNFVLLSTGERLWMTAPKPRAPLPQSVGAGGDSPPDRQRAEAAADDFAGQAGRNAAVGEGVEVVGATAPLPDSTLPSGSSPKSSGQIFGRIPRTAVTVINPRSGSMLPGLVSNTGENAAVSRSGALSRPVAR
jgi:hypothetical protein